MYMCLCISEDFFFSFMSSLCPYFQNGMVADYIERPANRPCSRAGKTPPPPPVRTSSRGATDSAAAAALLENHAPPLPARLYGSQDLPHFAPSSGV